MPDRKTKTMLNDFFKPMTSMTYHEKPHLGIVRASLTKDQMKSMLTNTKYTLGSPPNRHYGKLIGWTTHLGQFGAVVLYPTANGRRLFFVVDPVSMRITSLGDAPQRH